MPEANDSASASQDVQASQPTSVSQAITATASMASQPRITTDATSGKRPRDARLIHMILANMAVNAYQERVPLQLLDFCYRYTSGTLQDALHLTSELAQTTTGSGKISSSNNDLSNITLQALRLSIAAKTHYQFSPSLPKESMVELAAEKNRVALPSLGKDWGLRLPPERYCLTGVGYYMREEWDSEGEQAPMMGEDTIDTNMDENVTAEDSEGEDEKMEDVFGESYSHGESS